VEVLKKGHVLAVFPQGGISHDTEIKTMKSGAVLIALQAGVPIVPMHICPKKHWYSRRTVIIGNPIDPKKYIKNKFPSTKDIEQVSQVLMEEMNLCMMHQ
jgi:1-acyl-sn-glycerol-3-phosphate acyltransferase